MELWDILDEDGNRTGRYVERGEPMRSDEYHLVVYAWIRNRKGEYLISKRSTTKIWPDLWEPTGGCAVRGEDSLTATLREVKEELGINLHEQRGKLLTRLKYHSASPYIVDIWLFEEDVDISKVVYQPEEVSDARWATKEDIERLIEKNLFVKHAFILESLSLLD